MNDISNKSGTLAYKLGQAVAVVATVCIIAMLLALTIRCISWLL